MEKVQRLRCLCLRHGIIRSLSKDETFRGKNGSGLLQESFSYGHHGVQLRRNFESEWWHSIVTTSDTNYPMDCRVINDYTVHTTDSCGLFMDEAVAMLKDLQLQLPLGVVQQGMIQSCQSIRQGSNQSNRQLTSEVLQLQLYLTEESERKWLTQWKRRRLRWWKQFACENSPEDFTLEKSDQQFAIKYAFPWGEEDVETIRITSHQELVANHSGVKDLKCQDTCSPLLVTFTTFIERGIWALLCDAYSLRATEQPQERENQELLKIHSRLAPVKVVVLPDGSNKPHLDLSSCKLAEELRLSGLTTTCLLTGSLEERLATQDEVGTPHRILVDDDTLAIGVIQLQERDSGLFELMSIESVLPSILRLYSRSNFV